jgi:F-type H+-transporting ATPase subunit epsilon
MILKVLSAEKTVFTGNVTLVRFPGIDGSFTVLNNHAPMVAKLKEGTLVYTPESSSTQQSIEIPGGIARILDNEILVLTGA